MSLDTLSIHSSESHSSFSSTDTLPISESIVYDMIDQFYQTVRKQKYRSAITAYWKSDSHVGGRWVEKPKKRNQKRFSHTCRNRVLV